jgi:hypothetical protein
MVRNLLAAMLLLCVSSSCSSDATGNQAAANGTPCPDVSGAWHVTEHCDPSLVGATLVVTETECALSFAAPFNGFSGQLDNSGKLTLSGAQSCTGNAAASQISLTCTPGTCIVTLAR